MEIGSKTLLFRENRLVILFLPFTEHRLLYNLMGSLNCINMAETVSHFTRRYHQTTAKTDTALLRSRNQADSRYPMLIELLIAFW